MKINRTAEEMHKLLNMTPRIFWSTETHRCNYLKGLYDLITENLNENTVMVEVGSCAAVSSHLFAENVKWIHCVDEWNPYWEIDEGHIKESERLFNNFLKYYHNVTKVKKSSIEASKDFENAVLDFVYIDADHSYEAVMSDIKHWLPKIKPGGAIAGHDYHQASVKRAVSESFPNVIPKVYEDFSWFIKL